MPRYLALLCNLSVSVLFLSACGTATPDTGVKSNSATQNNNQGWGEGFAPLPPFEESGFSDLPPLPFPQLTPLPDPSPALPEAPPPTSEASSSPQPASDF